jgi:acetate kinase
MAQAILTLNAGSSSIKFALIEATASLARIALGEITKIGIAPHLAVTDSQGRMLTERNWDQSGGAAMSHEALLGPTLAWITSHLGATRLLAAAHRIVHGGRNFTGPVRLDAANMLDLEKLVPLAPLHQPHSLAAVRAVTALRPDLPQIGCFDTAFHHTLPAIASRFALTRELDDEGVRHYGFHGLSYEFIARSLRALAPNEAAGRVIAAHLGNGASLCAMKNGQSIDTTMTFTALDGLVMGTRCGSLDPGAVLYLMQAKGMTQDAISHLLYEKSGLLGVSGISADMGVLLASGEPRAREAVALFAYHAARWIGALTASLDGLDCLIFTAGIGQHAAPVRAAICARLGWLGVVLDPAANQKHAPVISAVESRVIVRVMATDEEATMARHAIEIVQPPSSPDREVS